MRLASLLLPCLCGCLAGRAPTHVHAPVPAPATPPPPATEPAKSRPPLPEPDPAWTLTPADVLLQRDYKPTMAVPIAGDPWQPHGRVPDFTLYRDGTVLYVDRLQRGEYGLQSFRIGDRDAAKHIEHVRALDVAGLRNYSDHCLHTGKVRYCVHDASVTILRARLPDGSLRELRNYAGFEPERIAQLHAIYDRIDLIVARPRDTSMYLPRAATLFVVALDRPAADRREDPRDRLRAWPLDAETLERALASGVIALEVPQIQAMIAATGSNIVRDARFELGDRLVRATMLPWLPDADHHDAVARAARAGGGAAI